MQGLPHAQGMLIAYLPKEKLVMEAISSRPGSERADAGVVTASHRTFFNNVQRLKLDVTTIAPIHGPCIPVAEFAKFVTSGKPATN